MNTDIVLFDVVASSVEVTVVDPEPEVCVRLPAGTRVYRSVGLEKEEAVICPGCFQLHEMIGMADNSQVEHVCVKF